MFVVICYDIPDDRRRLQVSNLLMGHGERVQRSAFEAHLTDAQFRRLRKRLDKLLKPEEDNVRFYSLCADCAKRVETIGKMPVTPEPTVWIV